MAKLLADISTGNLTLETPKHDKYISSSETTNHWLQSFKAAGLSPGRIVSEDTKLSTAGERHIIELLSGLCRSGAQNLGQRVESKRFQKVNLTLEPSQHLVLIEPCLRALCMEEQLLDRLCWWCIVQCLGRKAFKPFCLQKRTKHVSSCVKNASRPRWVGKASWMGSFVQH